MAVLAMALLGLTVTDMHAAEAAKDPSPQAAAKSKIYESATVPVREDLLAEHRAVWRRIGRAGTWWTAAERVAIAGETRRARDCELCRRRKGSDSPYAIPGEHLHAGKLSPIAVEAVHRITTDPARLTQTWVEGLMADGLSDAHYVELISVVVGVLAVDSLALGIGATLPPLPEPQSGAPTRQRPPQARLDGAWLPMVAAGEDTGLAAGIYGEAKRVPNVGRALSLVPDATRAWRRMMAVQYLPITDVLRAHKGNDLRALSRPQIELIAGRVSKYNECFY